MQQYTTTTTNNNRVSLLSQFDCVVPLRTQETNSSGGTFRLGLKNTGQARDAQRRKLHPRRIVSGIATLGVNGEVAFCLSFAFGFNGSISEMNVFSAVRCHDQAWLFSCHPVKNLLCRPPHTLFSHISAATASCSKMPLVGCCERPALRSHCRCGDV